MQSMLSAMLLAAGLAASNGGAAVPDVGPLHWHVTDVYWFAPDPDPVESLSIDVSRRAVMRTTVTSQVRVGIGGQDQPSACRSFPPATGVKRSPARSPICCAG
jgi:hypothetical protein